MRLIHNGLFGTKTDFSGHSYPPSVFFEEGVRFGHSTVSFCGCPPVSVVRIPITKNPHNVDVVRILPDFSS